MERINKIADKIFKTALAGLLLFTVVVFSDDISADTSVVDMDKVEITVGESVTLNRSVTNAYSYVEEKNGSGWVVTNNNDNITLNTSDSTVSAFKATENNSDIVIEHRYRYRYKFYGSYTTVTDRYTISVVNPTVTISFDKNGGSGTNPDSISNTKGTEITLPNYSGTKDGYEFSGWSTSKDGSSQVYPAKAAYTLTYTSTLYAAWSVSNLKTVSFDKNGGSGTNPDSISDTKGSTITLPDYTGTKSGYTFMGWSTGNPTSYDYASIYAVGSSYTIENSVTLKAVWAASNTNAIFYIRKDGTIPYEPAVYENSEYTAGIAVTNALKYNVWSADPTGVKVSNNLANTPSDAQIKSVLSSYDPATQYIKWYVIKYVSDGAVSNWHVDGVVLDKSKVELTYNGNSKDNDVKNVPLGSAFVEGSTVVVGHSGGNDGNLLTPTRQGYEFTGWNTAASGDGVSYNNNDEFPISTATTLYAQWKYANGTKYTIEIYKQNEDGTYNNSASKTIEKSNYTAANVTVDPTKYGYSGYAFDADNAKNVTSGKVAADGSLVLKLYYQQIIDVTVTGNTKTITYNGNTQEVTDYTVTGIKDGITINLKDGVEAKASGKDADTYTMGLTVDSFDVSSNLYKVNLNVTDGKLVINKKDASLKSATISKDYDGTALTNEDTALETNTGFVEGEGVDVTFTGSQVDAGYSANTYTYGASAGTNLDNYNISALNGILEVRKAAITVDVTGKTETVTYNGKEQSVTDYDVTNSKDGITISLKENVEAKASGTNADTYTMGLTKDSFNVVSSNYTVTLNVTDGKLVINKKAVTIKVTDATKQYKTDDPTFAIDSIEGLIDSDTLGDVSVKRTNTDEAVGVYENVLDAIYTANKNYEVTVDKGNFTITKNNTLSATAESVTATYDGKGHGIDVTTSIKGASVETVYKDANGNVIEGLPTNAGEYTATVTVTKEGYETKTLNKTVTINKKDASLKSATISKDYDGTALTNEDTALETNTGFVEGEGVDVTFTGSQVEAGSSANSYTYEANEGTNLANYNISSTEGDLIVNKKAITVNVTGKTETVTYNGKEQSVTGYDVTNSKDGITISLKENVEAKASGTNADTYTMGLTKDSFNVASNNYEVTLNVTDGKLVINKQAVTLKSATISKDYDGTALTNEDTALETNTGFVEGEGVDVTFTGSQLDAGHSANTYTYVASAGTNLDNYNISSTEGDLIVNKKAITVNVTGKTETVTYNGKEQSVADYDVTNSKDGITISLKEDVEAKASGTNADTYTMGLTEDSFKVESSNYTVTLNVTDGKLVINKKAITITAKDATKQFDTKDPEFSYTLSEDLVEANDLGTISVERINDYEAVGTYNNALNVTYNENSNYDVTVKAGNFTITPNTSIKASAEDVEETYDGKGHGITVKVDESVENVTVTTIYTDAKGNVIEGLPTNAGEYTAITTVSKVGYETVTLNNKVVINKAEYKVAITGNSDSAMYDGTEHSVSGYEVKTELPEGIEISLKDGIETVATGTNAVEGENAYKMGLSADSFNVVSQNYNVELLVTDGELIINPRPLTITVDSANKYVGDIDPEFSANVEGLLDADTLEYTLNREEGENAGDYTINVDYVNNPNYIVVVYPGTFSIITRTAPLNPPTNPTPTDPTVVPNVNIPAVINAINNNVQNIIVTPINEQIAQDATPQSENITDSNTPKSGLNGNYWALINLICAALTVLGGIIILIGKHSKEEDKDDENQQYNVEGEEEKENEKTRRRWTKFFGTFVALISVIVFVLTEDWTLPMVLLDKYTIIMVVITLVQAVTLVIAKKWKKADNDDNKEAQAA